MPAITRSARNRAAGASSLRAPDRRGPAGDAPRRDGRPVLRLALSRGALALELDAPVRLGPLEVQELSVVLESVEFPVDLSGGVARFRHRRGRLRQLALDAKPHELASALAPSLRGLLGAETPELTIAPVVDGIVVGIRSGVAAVAFEVLVAPIDEDLRFLPQRARGMGLGAPPSVVAVRAVGSMLGAHAERRGGAFVVRQAAGRVARSLLPEAGARAPMTDGLRWAATGMDLTRLWLEASDDALVPALGDLVLSALELADLTKDADDRALAGDLDGARAGYLSLLERAPRHPEISWRIAGIDQLVGGRAEAALSTLLEVGSAVDGGILGAELLAEVGDADGAATAMIRAGITEAYGGLAALAFLRAARLSTDEATRTAALDQAIARAPGMAEPRWARLEERLAVADLRGARADAEHLEAAAVGRAARFAVARRVADAFFERGFVRDAQSLYERALRYAPDDVAAVLGLARTLRELGQDRRGIDLFARAVALAERRGDRHFAAELELARALAEIAHDRPAAVARVRAIPADVAEAAEARLLEARWRAELGDLAGASLALGRLRDTVERAGRPEPSDAARFADLLLEAADIDEGARGDLAATQRDLALALGLRPRDRRIGEALRRVSSARSAPPADIRRAVHPVEAPPVEAPPVEGDASVSMDPNDEARAEALTQKVRANPADRAVVVELADVLWRLGRDLELFALLSARLEEGDPDTVALLAPRRVNVLQRLAGAARAEGRASEAELYESMLPRDDGAV